MSPLKPTLLVPLALLLVVSLPLASAHPVCVVVDNATTWGCAPTWGPLKPTCDAAAGGVSDLGDRAAAECEEVL